MIDIPKIHSALDRFIDSNPTEHYTVHIEKDDRQRPYLGLSGLGETCWRKLWYQWRHCWKPEFPSRVKRLLRTGDIYEYRIVWMLRGIGFEVFEVDDDGKQFSVSDVEGHVKGNLDGVAKVPEEFWLAGFTPTPLLTEFKTANDANFKRFVENGVEKTNSKYYGQIQGYCGQMELKGAIFIVVNKNDDDLYIEFVPAKKNKFNALMDKAVDIVSAQSPPDRIPYASVSYWDHKKKEGCKYCDALNICFKNAPSQKLCRTCVHASPGPQKSWVCAQGREYGEVCEKWKDIAHQ